MPLYKYMSDQVAPLFAGSLQVRFTQPSDLNDPFELHPLMDFVGTADEVREVVDQKLAEMFDTVDKILDFMEKQAATDPSYPKLAVPIQVFRQLLSKNPDLEKQFLEQMQKNKADVLDNMKMAALWEAQWEKFQKMLGEALGIFSLTENLADTVMWGHYASRHSGVVVEFDNNDRWFDQRISADDDFRHLQKVTYVENPAPRTWKQLTATDMLYTKSINWAYEREWRIIRQLKEGTEVSPGKFCFDVRPEAVLSIIFGCRTTPSLEKEIRDCVAANPNLRHVAFKHAKLGGGGRIELVEGG